MCVFRRSSDRCVPEKWGDLGAAHRAIDRPPHGTEAAAGDAGRLDAGNDDDDDVNVDTKKGGGEAELRAAGAGKKNALAMAVSSSDALIQLRDVVLQDCTPLFFRALARICMDAKSAAGLATMLRCVQCFAQGVWDEDYVRVGAPPRKELLQAQQTNIVDSGSGGGACLLYTSPSPRDRG